MKVLLGAVAALLCAVPALAQTPFGSGGRGSWPGCPGCGVYSYVDRPEPEVTVNADAFTLKGFGFECGSGEVAERVDVWYQDYDGQWQTIRPQAIEFYPGLRRTDVQKVYRPFCANVTAESGWHAYVTLPDDVRGLRRFKIIVWKGAYFEVHHRTYLIR